MTRLDHTTAQLVVQITGAPEVQGHGGVYFYPRLLVLDVTVYTGAGVGGRGYVTARFWGPTSRAPKRQSAEGSIRVHASHGDPDPIPDWLQPHLEEWQPWVHLQLQTARRIMGPPR